MNSRTSIALIALSLFAGTAGAQDLNPASGYLRLLNATDTIALSGPVPLGTSYTIEARIRYWGLPSPTAGMWPDAARLWSEQQDSTADKSVGFQPTPAGLTLWVSQMTQGSVHYGLNVSPLSDSAWHHLAIVRFPDRLRVFVDGQLMESVVASGFGTNGSKFSIGAFSYTVSGRLAQSVRADVDWFRISNSSRYTTDAFVPPTECSLVVDPETLVLFKFNEALQRTIASEGSLALAGVPGQGFPEATAPSVVLEASEPVASISGVQPISGPSDGGTPITVIGTGFTPESRVLVGGVPAVNVQYVSPTRLTAVTPQGVPGVTSVQVNCASSDAFYFRPYCGSDLDQDGQVTAADIAIVLLDFGPCYVTATSPQPDDTKPFMLQEQPAPEAPRSR